MSNFFNIINESPATECKRTIFRTEHESFSSKTSLKGRAVCLLMIPAHMVGVAAKPLMYSACAVDLCLGGMLAGIGVVIGKIFRKNTQDLSEATKEYVKQSFKYALTAIVSPVGQAAQVVKAAAGVILPNAYFKKPAAPAPRPEPRPAPEPAPGPLPGANPGIQDRANHTRVADIYNISCTFNYPVTQTADALRNFALNVANLNVNSIRVSYRGQNGIDAGGLRRDYVSRLFNAVSQQMHLQAGVPVWEEANHETLRQIGTSLRFFLKGINYRHSMTECPIGEVIHDSFYKGILSIMPEEIHANVDDLPRNRLIDIICEITEGDALEFAKKLQSFLRWDGVDQNTQAGQKHIDFLHEAEDIMAYDLPENTFNAAGQVDAALLEDIKNMLLDQYVDVSVKGRVKTLQTIAQGMNRGEQEVFDHMVLGAERVRGHIQGRFDKQRLKDCLAFRDAHRIPGIQAHINAWIDTKSEDELKRFTAYITGAPVIPADGITFNIQNYPRIMAHSCFRSVDLPENIGIDRILETLDVFCLEADANFDLA